MVYVAPGFWILFPLAALYVVLLLRLGAFRRDRRNPNAVWGPPTDLHTFLSREKYEERGQTLLTWVRFILLANLLVIGWMFWLQVTQR